MSTLADKVIDAKGLMCPEPLLRVKAAMESLIPGQRLHVQCTDPASVIDFKAYAAVTPHLLCQHYQEGDVLHFVLEKGSASG